MPTGYTATLCEKGQSFPDFIMECARAFGACITLRDEPDAPIPDEFKPSTYHTEQLAESRKLLAHLEAMDEAARSAKGEADQAEAIARYQNLISEELAQNARLSEMRAKVTAWTPPTDQHHGLKKFMLEQIDTSMGDTKYFEDELRKIEWQSPEFFFSKALDSAHWAIEYHSKGQKDEERRAKERTEWVKALRESIAEASQAARKEENAS